MNLTELSGLLQTLAPIVAIAISWASLNGKVKNLEDKVGEAREDIKTIKDNHLAHLQQAYEELKIDIAVIKNTCEVKNCGIKLKR